MCMLRKDFLIREDQDAFLKQLPGQISEHIRIAIDDYIKKMTPKAKTSPSKKGGDENGKKS